jgi:hypothetical protein
MRKMVVLFGLLASITSANPVLSGENYARQQQCNQCRANTNRCYQELNSFGSGVASATMSGTCVKWQAMCNRICNYRACA